MGLGRCSFKKVILTMAILTDIDFNLSYRTNMGNIVDMFYIPCMERSIKYCRAVGYFTSSGLAVAAKGLASFIKGEGKMYLVAGPQLREEDYKAIIKGYEDRQSIITKSLLYQLNQPVDKIVKNRLSCLAWLIANDRLEIKIAIPRFTGKGLNELGIYHEKIGIFEDTDGNKVAFTGSPNETAGGLVNNFESIDVYSSWKDPLRVADKETQFTHLWSNSTECLEVLTFTQAVREKLLEFKTPSMPTADDESSQTLEQGQLHGTGPAISPRKYQSDAIDKWVGNEYSGILNMATGTGKTKTALFAVQKVSQNQRSLLVVVVAPYKHLVEQWANEVKLFGHSYAICSSDYPDWLNDINQFRMALAVGSLSNAFLVTTYDTFVSPSFQNNISKIKSSKMIIADEVHHLGASSRRISLDQYNYRLGLSATPERTYDPDGTAWLLNNVGPIVFEFSLGDAIPDYLCPYNYYIQEVVLTRQEQEDYQKVMADISLACARGGNLQEEDPAANVQLGALLRKRQDIIGSASNKLQSLAKIVEEIKATGVDSLNYSLFYASSGLFDDLIFLLSHRFGLKVSKFTFEESRDERRQILFNFEEKYIQAIVAKKCLDEGMDIPPTRKAFILASSSNPMEFIQRRGRVLRKYSGKTIADIYDFFVTPSPELEINEYDRKLVERELARMTEFTKTALNKAYCERILLPIKRRYNLLHL